MKTGFKHDYDSLVRLEILQGSVLGLLLFNVSVYDLFSFSSIIIVSLCT